MRFGKFAGYDWFGRVSSLRASWTVPLILARSGAGFAGTWIGAEASGPANTAPFIQVGTNERSVASIGADFPGYYAFWSDTVHHFHPQRLFTVQAGDDMSAALTLENRHWRVAILDQTSGAHADFVTGEETRAVFSSAQWLQEDVTNSATSRPYPYPVLSTVRFTDLATDSFEPIGGELAARWMSAGQSILAPGTLEHDGFTIGPTTLTPAGRRYLAIAEPEDVATVAFLRAIGHWKAHTPRSQVAAAGSRFAQALDRDLDALVGRPWPSDTQGLISELTADTRVLLLRTQTVAQIRPSARAAWQAAWTIDAETLGYAAHLLRRALKLPDPTVPG
jgi:hypothetical protein